MMIPIQFKGDNMNFITKIIFIYNPILNNHSHMIMNHCYNRDYLRFAFIDNIQADLNRTMDAWNTYRTRSAVNDNGIPDELYFLPEISGKIF